MKSQTTTRTTKGTTITRGFSAIFVTRSSTKLKPLTTITELDTNTGSTRAFLATTSFTTSLNLLNTTTPNIIIIKIATVVFVNSPFDEGKPNGYFSMKSQIWTDADNNRAGMLLFVFDDSFWFEHDMPMYFGLSFRDFMLGKLSAIPGELPTLNDWENHLATIFPEVGLKGNLEMRGADGGSWRRLCALPAFWVKVLIYIEGNEVNEFVGVGARFGPTLESKEKHANQTRLALADPPHCCSTPENKLTEGVMLVHRGKCSFMAKANVTEAAGASAILIINNCAVGTILCASYWSVWSAREAAIEQDKLLKDASEDFSMETMGSSNVVDISNSLCFDCFWFIEVLVVLFAIGGAEGLQTCLVALLTRQA